jgi:hypothetical protein
VLTLITSVGEFFECWCLEEVLLYGRETFMLRLDLNLEEKKLEIAERRGFRSMDHKVLQDNITTLLSTPIKSRVFLETYNKV